MERKLPAVTRNFEVLRISVTSSCGLACAYCAPRTSPTPAHSHLQENPAPSLFLPPSLLQRKLAVLQSRLHIKEVHLTGGEPTLHRALPDLIETIALSGIKDIALTSNGFFAQELLETMKLAGLTRINFSCDSLSADGFARMSGRNVALTPLLENIDHAQQLGLPVKMNCTVVRGYNEDQITPLLRYAGNRNIPIRYLELMKMGPLHDDHQQLFVSAAEIRDKILEEYSFSNAATAIDSTANYFKTDEGFRFGTIANHTEPFCHGCNRIRMDARGNIYGCLSDPTYYQIPDSSEGQFEEIDRALRNAMQTKKSQFTGSSLSMKFIGG